MNTIKRITLLSGLFASFAVSIWAIAAENTPLTRLGPTATDRLLSGQPSLGIPLSAVAQRNLIADCHTVFADELNFGMILASPDERAEAALLCREWSTQILKTTPNYSYAWYVSALAAAELNDWPEFNRALSLSQASGPYEQWIGEYRVALAENHFDQLSDTARVTHTADLTMLVNSSRGVRSIADRYLTQESFRNRITDIVEQAPAEQQRRFLNYLRRRT